MNSFFKKVTIIAPHPDDEILGCGGTISKLIKLGSEINILFVSGHLPPIYKTSDFEKTKRETIKAMKYLGVMEKNYKFLKIPATKVHEITTVELNKKIYDFIKKSNPEAVFTCFPDRHIDHRTIFESTMVATRPVNKIFPKFVLCLKDCIAK